MPDSQHKAALIIKPAAQEIRQTPPEVIAHWQDRYSVCCVVVKRSGKNYVLRRTDRTRYPGASHYPKSSTDDCIYIPAAAAEVLLCNDVINALKWQAEEQP